MIHSSHYTLCTNYSESKIHPKLQENKLNRATTRLDFSLPSSRIVIYLLLDVAKLREQCQRNRSGGVEQVQLIACNAYPAIPYLLISFPKLIYNKRTLACLKTGLQDSIDVQKSFKLNW